ncbi:MAG: hypothetical protein FWH11_09435 [Micrococcales bacterium]|nr:hypothetical protein [Micrococcales bacterium]
MTRLLCRPQGDDRGMSLVVVIAVTAVMATLVVAGTAMALSSQRHGHRTAAWDASLAAAYGGVEDYRSRLTANPEYWRYGNPAAPFTLGSGSAVVAPPIPNPAFDTTPGGSWGTIVSHGDGAVARYRYEVDTSEYESLGRIRLRSTGAVGNDTRTVVASIGQEGFIRFLYWSDYEIMQSAAEGATCRNNAWDTVHNRLKYAWEGRSCGGDVYYGGTDVFNGPFYTNDQPMICDGTFNDVVLTMPLAVNPTSLYRPYSCGGGPPSFAVPPQQPEVPIELPPTNAEMKRETRYDLAANPGCLYTGPTAITFGSDGTMTVRSPWTKFTQTSGSGDTVGRNTAGRCGAPGTGPNQLGHADGATVPVVEGSLVFVQNVPTSSANVNYTAQDAAEKAARCGAADGSQNGLGYPLAGEDTTRSRVPRSYGCTVGDVFVKGQFKGHMSVAAENYLWIASDQGQSVGGVTYATSGSVLGLVGQAAVMIWHPVTATGVNILAVQDVRIDGAVLSVAGTMAVQNYDLGAHRGNIVLFGAVAQKYLDPTECYGCTGAGWAGNTTGFGTDFTYDTRLQNIAPPKFLQPSITTFKATQVAEVRAAFDPEGSFTG